MIDADTPRVEVHLAADAPGEERRLPTIFAVADDRMADRRHMNAQLMRAPGEGLKLDPGGAIARAFDHAVAAARELPVILIDVHLLAAGARLFGERQLDAAVLASRPAVDERHLHPAPAAPPTALVEADRRARRPTD